MDSQLLTPTNDRQHTEDVREKISKGILALEGALFEHASYEAMHLTKLRTVVDMLEKKVYAFLDKIDANDPQNIEVLVNYMNMAAKYMEKSMTFLERMHKLSVETNALMALMDRFNDSLDAIPKEKLSQVDKQKVKDVQRKLIHILSRKDEPVKKKKKVKGGKK